MVNYTVSMSTNGNQLVAARLVLNGVAITGTVGIGHCHGGGVGISVVSGTSVAQISSGNVIDIQVTNQTNTAAILVSWVTVVLTELPAI